MSKMGDILEAMRVKSAEIQASGSYKEDGSTFGAREDQESVIITRGARGLGGGGGGVVVT